MTNTPLSLPLRQTKQDRKTRHHLKARSWSIYSPIPTPTLWSQHSPGHMARVLADLITLLQHTTCVQSIGWGHTLLQSNPLFPPSSNPSPVPPQQPQPSSPPWLHHHYPHWTQSRVSSKPLPSSSPILSSCISSCSPGP